MDINQLSLLNMISGKNKLGSLGLGGDALAPNVGVANNLDAGKVGMPDLSANQDAMKIGMEAAVPEEKAFDLKGLATDLNAILKSQEQKQAEITSELDAAMAANKPQGVLPATPMAPAQQVGAAQAMPSPAAMAMSGQPQPGMSGAMQAIQGQQPSVGIGAQPSVQEMMRRIYGQ
jgi:hypothetical protein